MHDLVARVLDRRDLSKAGDLFALSDWDVIDDFQSIVYKLKDIFNTSTYITDVNSQSVVEICLARITSAIGETKTIEIHACNLVDLLESAIQHDLSLTSEKNEEAPHAKIASDILSCLFLHYTKKDVMTLAIPAAIKLLHKGNMDLVRHTSSYLSLAAIHNARLIASYARTIIDSIVSGNYPLVRVLSLAYAENPEPFHGELLALTGVLMRCELAERLSLLQFFSAVAAVKPELVAPLASRFKGCLFSTSTCSAVFHIYLRLVAKDYASALYDQIANLKEAGELCGASQSATVMKIIAAVGKLNKENAAEAAGYFVLQSHKADSSFLSMLLKELEKLAFLFPEAVRPHLPDIVQRASECHPSSGTRVLINKIKENCQRTQPAAGVTLISVNKPVSEGVFLPPPLIPVPSTPTYPKGRSISIGNLAPLNHSGLIRARQLERIREELAGMGASREMSDGGSIYLFPTGHSNGYQPLELNAKGRIVPCSSHPYHRIPEAFGFNNNNNKPGYDSTGSRVVTTFNKDRSITQRTGSGSVLAVMKAPSVETDSVEDQRHSTIVFIDNRDPPMTDACTQSTDTLQSSRYSTNSAAAVAIPDNGNLIDSGTALRSCSKTRSEKGNDAVKQFCEKHFRKIRTYMTDAKYPIPIQCTVEESNNKERMRIHFACQERSEYCLHNHSLFVFKTKYPALWLHLMFLQIQAQSLEPVGQKNECVVRLRMCWDCLPHMFTDGRSFTALVTSAFPNTKDQQLLISELQASRYFDVFSYNVAKKRWCCFACNRPDKVRNFLNQSNSPVIEGQLKEKKGRWKFFKRWRTRYFTLSAASLSYRGSAISESAAIDLRSIRSVKSISSRKGRRSAIPKAFEIFTDDNCSYMLKAKDRKNAQEWFQCLQIAVAQAQKVRQEYRL